MAIANSRETGNEEPTQNRAPAAMDPYTSKSNGQIPGSDSRSLGRRLDVDAVLERSFRKVVSEPQSVS